MTMTPGVANRKYRAPRAGSESQYISIGGVFCRVPVLAAVFQNRSGALGWALTLIQTFSISVGFFHQT
jgi:hypothetical protein